MGEGRNALYLVKLGMGAAQSAQYVYAYRTRDAEVTSTAARTTLLASIVLASGAAPAHGQHGGVWFSWLDSCAA